MSPGTRFGTCRQRPMFMTAADFEARHCPTLRNEFKKTKIYTNTEAQAGIGHFVVG